MFQIRMLHIYIYIYINTYMVKDYRYLIKENQIMAAVFNSILSVGDKNLMVNKRFGFHCFSSSLGSLSSDVFITGSACFLYTYVFFFLLMVK